MLIKNCALPDEKRQIYLKSLKLFITTVYIPKLL